MRVLCLIPSSLSRRSSIQAQAQQEMLAERRPRPPARIPPVGVTGCARKITNGRYAGPSHHLTFIRIKASINALSAFRVLLSRFLSPVIWSNTLCAPFEGKSRASDSALS